MAIRIAIMRPKRSREAKVIRVQSFGKKWHFSLFDFLTVDNFYILQVSTEIFWDLVDHAKTYRMSVSELKNLS